MQRSLHTAISTHSHTGNHQTSWITTMGELPTLVHLSLQQEHIQLIILPHYTSILSVQTTCFIQNFFLCFFPFSSHLVLHFHIPAHHQAFISLLTTFSAHLAKCHALLLKNEVSTHLIQFPHWCDSAKLQIIIQAHLTPFAKC